MQQPEASVPVVLAPGLAGVVPRVSAKGRGRGKAKGKGKAKSKAKAKAKAKARALAALAAAQAAAAAAAGGEVIEGGPATPVKGDGVAGFELALPSPKAKANPMKKKAVLMLQEVDAEGNTKNVDDVISEQKTKLQQAEAELKEKESLEKAQLEQAEAGKKEYEEATAATQKAIDEEISAGTKFKELNEKKQTALAEVEMKRNENVALMKKVAQMEVMLINETRMKELKERQEAAQRAADEAKKQLLLQRQKEKEAIEETRRQLALLKGKGAGRGVKRPAQDMATETSATTQVQEGATASQDID